MNALLVYPLLRILHQGNTLRMRGQERFLPPPLAFLLRVPIPLSSLREFGNDSSTKDHSHKSLLAYNREYHDFKIIVRINILILKKYINIII